MNLLQKAMKKDGKGDLLRGRVCTPLHCVYQLIKPAFLLPFVCIPQLSRILFCFLRRKPNMVWTSGDRISRPWRLKRQRQSSICTPPMEGQTGRCFCAACASTCPQLVSFRATAQLNAIPFQGFGFGVVASNLSHRVAVSVFVWGQRRGWCVLFAMDVRTVLTITSCVVTMRSSQHVTKPSSAS